MSDNQTQFGGYYELFSSARSIPDGVVITYIGIAHRRFWQGLPRFMGRVCPALWVGSAPLYGHKKSEAKASLLAASIKMPECYIGLYGYDVLSLGTLLTLSNGKFNFLAFGQSFKA